MAQENFIRRYLMKAGKMGHNGFQIGQTSTENPHALHISFSIEKSTSETANTAKVQIWNLSPANLSVLDTEDCVIELQAGYAPCLSTLFIDRPPMSPQGLIQAFSRTNRLYDQNKEYGQIVTFRSPKEYKKKINDALVLYSKGGIGQAIAEDWETVLNNFVLSLKTIRTFAPTPADVNGLSKKQKKTFIKLFRDLDHDYAHLKSFSTFEPKILDEYGFSQQIYEDYAAIYNNVIEELKKDPPDDTGDEPIRDDYDLVAYSKFKIDFEYIVELLQGFVDFLDQKDIEFNEAEFEHKLLELKEIVKDFAEDNSKLSDLLLQVLDEIEQDDIEVKICFFEENGR